MTLPVSFDLFGSLGLSLCLKSLCLTGHLTSPAIEEPGAHEPSADEPSVAEIFAGMAARLENCSGIHARTTHVETLASGKSYRQRFEMHWNGELRTLRCQWAYGDAPYPTGTALLTPERLDVADHVLRQRWSKLVAPDTPLSHSLVEAGLDPVWRIAFSGRLSAGGISVGGNVPRLAHDVETAGADPCHRLLYPGLHAAQIWVSTEDGLPRRLECTMRPAGQPAFVLTQEVESVAADARLDPELFRLTDLEGYEEVPLAQARAEWRRLRQYLGSRLRPAEEVPDFEALDLEGEIRNGSDLPSWSLIVFWLAQPLGLEQLQDAREMLDGRDDAPSLIGICGSSDLVLRERLAERTASDARRLRVWTTSLEAEGALRRFRVYRCPAYFLVRDGVVEVSTRSLEEIRSHLDSSASTIAIR